MCCQAESARRVADPLVRELVHDDAVGRLGADVPEHLRVDRPRLVLEREAEPVGVVDDPAGGRERVRAEEPERKRDDLRLALEVGRRATWPRVSGVSRRRRRRSSRSGSASLPARRARRRSSRRTLPSPRTTSSRAPVETDDVVDARRPRTGTRRRWRASARARSCLPANARQVDGPLLVAVALAARRPPRAARARRRACAGVVGASRSARGTGAASQASQHAAPVACELWPLRSRSVVQSSAPAVCASTKKKSQSARCRAGPRTTAARRPRAR